MKTTLEAGPLLDCLHSYMAPLPMSALPDSSEMLVSMVYSVGETQGVTVRPVRANGFSTIAEYTADTCSSLLRITCGCRRTVVGYRGELTISQKLWLSVR